MTAAVTQAPAGRRRRLVVAAAVLAGLAAVLADLSRWADAASWHTWATLFVAMALQALPFLVGGVLVSAAVAAWMPADAITRRLPSNRAAAVGCAASAGVLLPGCECGSVPISGRLIARGAPPSAALAFMLAAPAVNPVVLAATAVAFPGRPELVVARFAASLLTAAVVGWLWLYAGDSDRLAELARARVPQRDTPAATFTAAFRHDFIHAGAYLSLGAAAAASLQTFVPGRVVDTLAANPVLAVAAMALLAIALSVCSEADAFVAAGLSQFSLQSRLVFLVVGPAVDLKLIALQAGFFGRAFTLRFAPLTALVAVTVAVVTGWVLL